MRPELLTKQGLPPILIIDLEVAPEKVGPQIKTKWGTWDYVAHEYPPDICRWFSVAVQKEVKAIRAGLNFRNGIKKKYQPLRKDDDVMKGFYRGA